LRADRKEIHDRKGAQRLAAPRLADEAHRLAAPDVEIDAADGMEDAARDGDVDAQPADLQERLARGQLGCTSAIRSRSSASAFGRLRRATSSFGAATPRSMKPGLQCGASGSTKARPEAPTGGGTSRGAPPFSFIAASAA